MREEPVKKRLQAVYKYPQEHSSSQSFPRPSQLIDPSRQLPLASLPVACRASGLDIVQGSIALSHLQNWLLCLEFCKRLLRVPHPWRGASEEKIHLLEGSLVRLGVQGPDYRYRNDIGDSKDVKRRRPNPYQWCISKRLQRRGKQSFFYFYFFPPKKDLKKSR
jgi:hypothetical protein